MNTRWEGKKGKKKTLRSPKEVVKSEQNASHQFKKKHKKSFNTTTKKTGKFEGKSNALGHGGRAAPRRGELVRLLEVSAPDAGIKVWDGRNSEGHKAASGVYIVRVQSGSDERTLKVAVER